ncbi:ABC transporter ATP-binding protein [Synergistales bacterium]|nr:ABC transporter ATP-binding protein [Synergistales bacterium]
MSIAAAPKKLSAVGLRKSYKDRLIVDGVDIEVKQGEVVGLLGPNGAGKTTSFYMIVGLVRPDAGSVFIGETNVTALPVYKRSRLGIGYLPQETSVFRNLTVRENLELVYQEMGKRATISPKSLMRRFGVSRLADTKGHALSGGEKRRVEIARAMPIRPDFILLDEPFSGIDPIAVNDIQDMIQDLRAQNFGVLITDHNVRETLSITDRTYLIHNGRIILNGKPEEVMEDPLARKFYLGDNFEW